MEKILACLDFSKNSDEVEKLAARFLTGSNEYELYFLTVVNTNIEYYPVEMGMFTDPFEARRAIAKELLTKVKEKFGANGVHIITSAGDPKKVILDIANNIEADFIMIGTHGRTGWSHLMMGSNAEYVVRHATIPVISVPYNKHAH